MNEKFKYEIIERLVETNGNMKYVALRLNCSFRNVNRMKNGYHSMKGILCLWK